MAAETYFSKFPKIQYSNTTAIDITKRVALANVVISNPLVYYPYELSDFERPDQLSHRYYNDAYKSWIIYLSNQITDPYYEWYLQNKQFGDFIDTKYGSYNLANLKVKYYRNNWYGSEKIDVNYYKSLPSNLQDYWEPSYVNNTLTGYTRKKQDWIINTNKIYSYQVNSTDGFIQDEFCHVVFDNGIQGNGQILAIDANNNTVVLQHTIGTMNHTITFDSYFYGVETGTNTHIVSASLVANNIIADEEEYWSPVTYFQYESEKNEYNKSVLLLDNKYSKQTSENLRTLMSKS